MARKPDFYWQKSKDEGYPARSVFKLQEIQEKLHPLRPGTRVLDLGASPGSWSLWLLDTWAGAGAVVGVDLNPPDQKLLARRGYRFIQGDFLTPEVRALIAEGAPYDAIVSDAAPSTTGTRSMDTARSAEIARTVLAFCRAHLARSGCCVLKIFQGGEEREILGEMRALFDAARAFKPKASRSESMETYFIGTGWKGTMP
jgi:23S rRNA (uridine2552-2'-O)-methyltransferase